MKQVLTVVMTVLMLGAVAFTPYAPAPSSTAAGLSAPTLIAPANNSTVHTGPVTWSWKPVPGAARYHLQAGFNTAFDQQYNIIDQSVTAPSYTFNASSGFVFYFPRLYWRVQAISASNIPGPWSEVRRVNLVNP